MLVIIHRVNTIEKLKTIPREYGVEIDIRAHGNRLILNHEPFEDGENLAEYLKHYQHAFVIFNIKEAGIEHQVMETAKQFGISNYFLLDVEPYYIHHATKAGIRNIAVRFSENEPIESALIYSGKADWLWIDIPTMLPVHEQNKQHLAKFHTCLVCPERWGRPHEISDYIQKLQELQFPLTAVMTSLEHAPQWAKYNIPVLAAV
jgi:hypothetical protein